LIKRKAITRFDVCPRPAIETWQREDEAMTKGNYLSTVMLALGVATVTSGARIFGDSAARWE
jgi:hypothetical protein